jgi:hypothetical protein
MKLSNSLEYSARCGLEMGYAVPDVMSLSRAAGVENTERQSHV